MYSRSQRHTANGLRQTPLGSRRKLVASPVERSSVVEQLAYIQRVEGSIPSVPMIFVVILYFPFLEAPVVRWVLFFCRILEYDEKKKGDIMLNQRLLIDNNKNSHNFNKHKICFKNGKAIFRISSEVFTGNELKQIIYFIDYVIDKYPNIKIPIEIYLGRFYFHDKLVYVLLECICNYLLSERKQQSAIFLQRNIRYGQKEYDFRH